MSDTIIHIVTFDGLLGQSIGGFDWDLDQKVINARYDRLVAEDGASYRIRQWAIDLNEFETEFADPTAPTEDEREQMTSEIDSWDLASDEIAPLLDNHAYLVETEGAQEGDRGGKFVAITVERPAVEAGAEESTVEVVVHQSVTNTPALNFEIDGDFTHELNVLRVHINGSIAYASSLADLDESELADYRRHLLAELEKVEDAL